MSMMEIINDDGLIEVEPGTLKAVRSDHPVYKARVAIALPKGKWLFAPDQGHELDIYSKAKATDEKFDEFQKSARLYLSPYGPEVTDRLINRGQLGLSLNIAKETDNG